MSSAQKQNISSHYIQPKNQEIFPTKMIGLPARRLNLDEFLSFTFGEENKENLCIFIKRSDDRVANSFYPVNDRIKIKRYFKMTLGTNQYLSVSTYFKTQKNTKLKGDALRTQNNIVHTYMVYLDLDYYKTQYSRSQVLLMLKKMITSGEVLCPSTITFTGRGIQLGYKVQKFKNIENYTNDKDFRIIQEYLIEKFKHFNSDVVSKNPSAVMRLTDGFHPIAKQEVLTYLINENVYTLKDMMFYHNLVPNPDRKVKPRKYKKIAETKKTENNVVRNTLKWNEFTLNRQREFDVFIYVNEMNRRNTPYPAKRNWLALLLRFHALVSSDGDFSYAQNRVQELCNIMDLTDSSESEILRRSKPAERFYEQWVDGTWDRKKYVQGGMFYTNKRLLELMEIEMDYEMQWKMKTIKIRNNKYEAARKRFERLRSGEVKGTLEEYNSKRLSQKEQRILEIKNLLDANPKLKQQEISEKIGISRSRVAQLMIEIKKC